MAKLSQVVENLEQRKYIVAPVKADTTNVPEGYEDGKFSAGAVWFIEADVEE